MTDNEIIKALECCNSIDSKHCKYCPLFTDTLCNVTLRNKSLDLVNRQQAEIERLTAQKMSREEDRDYWMAQTRIARDNIKFAKTEAIKEFAERLKTKGTPVTGRKGFEGVFVMCSNLVIDNLVKEMTEVSEK